MPASPAQPGGSYPGLRPRAETAPALLSIVCPAYNESDTIVSFHKAVSKAMRRLAQPFEIVFVNDGSTDDTLLKMRELRSVHPNTAIVDLSRNFGKEIALTAGLDQARGDAVVVMDADLQDPPDVIAEFIAGWREGYDVVYAQRRIRNGESWLKKATAAAFYRMMRGVGPTPLPENVGDFRLMSRKTVDAVCALRERHRFMKGVFAWVGFPAKVIQYDRAPREAGATKWNYWKLWNLSLEGLTSSTLAPLKLSTYFGFAVAGFAFLLGVFFIIKTLIYGDPVQGFPTLATLILFLGGVQLMVLGVMGEYLGRIFNETKHRPLYFTNAVEPSEAAAQAGGETAEPALLSGRSVA
ncbi:glycosyltransferase family 2 protein [Hyphococcus sp.]|uniref:glycosyltransferase family 2 protein n=1 Tax=Hyphococcus sp. TaxID=2038636 RepID=UPI003D131566